MMKRRNLAILGLSSVVITSYFILLFTYYHGFITSFIFVGILLAELLLLLISVVFFRNHKSKVRKISFAAIILSCLICFELRLLFFEAQTYTASFHADPIELFEDSGIRMIVVTTRDIGYLTNEKHIIESYKRDNLEIINVYKIDNKMRYHSKNNELLNWVGIKKDDFAVMGENVKLYLGEETELMNNFLNREDLSGDSAGLGLALSGLIGKGELKNNVLFGVTGALSATGEVLPVGMVKEKILIAEKKGYPFIIIPSKNSAEANNVISEHNLEIEVFDVPHIDQAIRLINSWNEN